jgi:hypothetical protein
MAPPPLDTIDLLINGREVLCAKEYDVVFSYFTTPSTFSLTVGSGGTTLDLMRQCPPNSLFALRVNGIVQFMGFTDGFGRIGGGPLELAISGRDRMAQLIRAHVPADRSFHNATFAHLAEEAIRGAGISKFNLTFDSAGQRAAVVGVPVIKDVPAIGRAVSAPVTGVAEEARPERLGIVAVDPRVGPVFDILPATQAVRAGTTVVSTLQEVTVQRITGYKAERPIKWDIGQTYLAAFKKEGDRGALFLRAGVDPTGRDPNVFLLDTPDPTQEAKFFLLNTREELAPNNAVLVGPRQLRYELTGRYSDYEVHGQAGGGKGGREPIIGTYHDEEVARAGISARCIWKDPQAKNKRQADFLARKKRAEDARASESFVYPIPHRHTVPLITNPAQRIVPAPGLMGRVRDDEIGVDGVFWVERVRHHSSVSGGTFTELTLIDPQHLVLGLDEATQPVSSRAPKKGWSRRR